ncbi:MAG: P1 family peptidase [Rhodobacteraceae bacterium]|nr:P1 family peptidase [Paracoccaceae bacterium]
MSYIPPATPRPRARALGLPFPGTPGPLNAITDVAGVQVGFTTLTDPARAMRTGVTAIRPRPDAGHPQPVLAGHFSLNGNGEMTGTHWIDDAGYFCGPVCITNTHSVGAVHHGVTQWMIRHYEAFFRDNHGWAMPVVAETYDGTLNDINALHVTPDHAVAAIEAARGGPVAEGSSGGGNGMICYEFKGGTGTASRRVEVDGRSYMLGVLLQANFGRRARLRILGRPVGELMPEGTFDRRLPPGQEAGSVIVVIATDAPLSRTALRALAKRGALGIARTGTEGGNGSGDIFLAFSTAAPGPMPELAPAHLSRTEINSEHLNPLYLAAVEATEEAVVNALVAGEDVPSFRPAGEVVPAIDTARLAALFA